MSQAAGVHDGPASPCSPASALRRGRGVSRRLALLSPSTASLLHTLLHRRANVTAANEHEQAGYGKSPMPSWRRVPRAPDRIFVTDSNGFAVIRHAISAVRRCDQMGAV